MSRFTDLFQESSPVPEPESGFNPDAKGHDGDGLVQKETSSARPAPVKTVKATAKKGTK